ncbi:MAG TPA: class II aldolase/adducin family protein [Vicinamibacterales bacterium]|nr:class II aldolase/adducin family protein [Vicinamibacterales bacterium]
MVLLRRLPRPVAGGEKVIAPGKREFRSMSVIDEAQVRNDIVEVGRRLYARGYVASNDGNISVRLDDSRIMTTPKGVSKGFMTPDMMCVVSPDGTKLSGERDPSSELLMHLEVYRQRPDVRAVVHAHPPLATGFAVAGIPLDRAVLAEVITTLGSIPIAEYGTPSTRELPEAVRRYIKAHDGLLLANHGALTVAHELFAAYYKMETIEHFAKISLVARLLGGERLLTAEEVARLQALRGSYGIASPAPICIDGDSASAGQDASCQVVRAPDAPGLRLVPETLAAGRPERPGDEAEIRLTYRELTALIEDAVRSLR